MNDTSGIRVNLSAVENNVRVLREIVGPDCALCPIVKADGYGLGAPPIARHLVAAGADMLAVYTPAQAAELARAAVGGPILVLCPVRDLARNDEAYRLFIRGDLHLTVHDGAHLDDLLKIAERFANAIPLHLDVDTGMGRGGCSPAEAPEVVRRISASRWLRLAGISTHFARPGTDARFTQEQLETFEGVIDACGPDIPKDCLVHAGNTLATIRHRRYHKRMVRVGQGWAGLGAQDVPDGAFKKLAAQLRAVVTWRSRLVHVKTVEKGAFVGYGSRWTAPRRSLIGLVPVGYADGYPMGAASLDARPGTPCVGVEVSVSATKTALRFAPVVGQVNMDQVTIDLTDAVRRRESAPGPGTIVELMGTDPRAPNHPVNLARAAGTVPHELLCRLNPRIKRIYHHREPYGEEAPLAAAAAAS
jgi:alanine racemase